MRLMRHAATAVVALALSCAAAGADEPAPRPGTTRVMTDERFGLFRRSYVLHLPPATAAEPLPLVVMLHGAFSSGRRVARESGLDAVADREGFAVVYPEGIGLAGLLRHWNAGMCCAKALEEGVDDVGFVARVVDLVAATVAVDPRRVYVAGHSNGGMLAYRVAAELAPRFAAAAAVSATAGGQPTAGEPLWQVPAPAAPVPILMIHGSADEHVPYGGGKGERTKGDLLALSFAASRELWREHDGCGGEPAVAVSGRVHREAWSCRDGSEVVAITLDGWGHAWPGGEATAALPADDPLRSFDATEELWRFFQAHPGP